MKQLFKRTLSFALSLLLLCGAALASEAYGPERYATEIPLGQGTALKTSLFWSDTHEKLRSESYIEYIPNDAVQPLVEYGSSVRSATSPAAVEDRLRQRGLTMVGGINGDYFVMATGENLGLLITDGILRSTDGDMPAAGFLADGSALLGTPDLTVTLTGPGGTSISVDEVNKTHNGAPLVLFTGDYGADTGALAAKTAEGEEPVGEEEALYVILHLPSGPLMLGDSITARVERQLSASGAMELSGETLVLRLSDREDPRYEFLTELSPGQTVELTVTAADARWNDVRSAVGGMHLLVENGEPVKGLEVSTAPRTVLGVRPDGSMVFYTSASYSSGANTSLDQVAVRLTELGCETALLLDGGGSTTLSAAYPGSSAVSTVNTPSLGRLRSCSNYLVLATALPADGAAQSLWVYPYDVALLSGAEYDFSARAADGALRAAPLPDGLIWSVTGGVGTVDEMGLFKAGAAGTGNVTVSGGGLEAGSATVRVVGQPDDIRLTLGGLRVTELTLATGDSVALTATAYFDDIDLISANSCFTWTLDGVQGTVTEDGVLEAGGLAGEGTLTVSASGTTVSVPVKIRGNPFPDMVGHWAVSCTTMLHGLGYIQGVELDGIMYYQPEHDMNRAQFAVLMANVLELDPAAYEDISLPFADGDTLPAWALGAIRAVYGEGLMLGTGRGDVVYFDPYAPLTRAEGVTVIGRAFPSEEPEDTERAVCETEEAAAATPEAEPAEPPAALQDFPDWAQVPVWAETYFADLVERGVINGMDGLLAPLGNLTRAQVAKIFWVLLAEG